MSLALNVLPRVPRSEWLAWLRRELAPFPGRETMVLRMVVTVVLVVIISMTLQVPEAALSAYMVFFVTRENHVLTALTGVLMIVGVTLAIAASLLLYRVTFDYPELRIPFMAVSVFTGMYLSRVFVIGPLGFAIGFVIAVTQSAAESAPDTDTLVRALLWVWVAIIFPIALTVVISQVLLPVHPWAALMRLLTRRLDAATGALQRAIDDGAAGGRKNDALLELATRGSAPLFVLLHFAEMKDEQLKRQHTSRLAAILASERLVSAAAALEMRTRQTFSNDDLTCAKTLLAGLAQLRAALQANDFSPLRPKPDHAAPAIAELRELQSALAAIREGLTGEDIDGQPASGAKAKKAMFTPDAFTNPAHIHFAFKVTLAAMSCYLIYSALDWPGIHTAFITCCIIALESTGATMRKGWLRITGCLTGALLGFLSIMYLVPQMESIVSLILLTAAVSALAGWVATSERIAYCGLQMAFAFYMCLFQGFAPKTDFETIRDRIVGIVLGIVVSSFVFRHLWPERAVDRLRTTLAQAFRSLARLLLIPGIGANLEAELKTAAQLRGEITKHLDDTLKMSELAEFEFEETPGLDGPPLPALESLAAHGQAVCLIETLLAGETALDDWRRLDKPAQEAEAALRAKGAEQLQRTADYVAGGLRSETAAFQTAFTIWNRSIASANENDRARLLRRLGNEIQQLAD